MEQGVNPVLRSSPERLPGSAAAQLGDRGSPLGPGLRLSISRMTGSHLGGGRGEPYPCRGFNDTHVSLHIIHKRMFVASTRK